MLAKIQHEKVVREAEELRLFAEEAVEEAELVRIEAEKEALAAEERRRDMEEEIKDKVKDRLKLMFSKEIQ